MRDMEKQRLAKKRWYERNRDVYFARNKVRRDALRAFVSEMKGQPCMDCGGTFPPECMDYDHRGGKKMAVSKLVNSTGTRTSLMAEVAKCDLVCANCHRIRTRRRLAEDAA